MEDFEFIVKYPKIKDNGDDTKSKLIAKMFTATKNYDNGNIEEFLATISKLDRLLVDKE